MIFASSTFAVEPICPGGTSPDPNVIWCEDWENQPEAPAHPLGWIWDGGWWDTNGSGVFSSQGRNNSKGMKFVVVAGSSTSPYPDKYITPSPDVYFRFYIKWANGFIFSPITTKVAYIRMLQNSQMVGKLTVQISPAGKPRLGTSADLDNFIVQNQGNDITVIGGQWYSFEIRAKANTPGISDGIAQLWVDGILRASYNNINYGFGFNINNIMWNDIWLTGYWNNPADVNKLSWYDDIVVSTSYIGPMDGGGGGDTGGSSGSDSSASGGSGCGFVKDSNGKGQKANGEGLPFAIMLIMTLIGIALVRMAFKRRTATSKAGGKLLNFKSGLIVLTLLFLFVFVAYTPARATMYFYFDAEDGTVGNSVPNPPICTEQCGTYGVQPTYQSSGGAPQGSKYFQWQTYDNQPSNYTEVHNTQGLPIANIIGKTYYLAYFFNFTRINGLDIWHETGQSGDKGVELVGSDLRWAVGGGHWPSHADNQDHRYTIMVGNATYHLNPQFEVQDGYVQNQSGYNGNNPLQFQYEHWYSIVMAVKMATDNTGSFTVYIDGVKLYEYNNIKTVATTSATITDIKMGGSIAQGAYDAPAHYRKFDALILTDNWQDIVNGGYLKTRPSPAYQNPPQPQ